MKTAEEFYEKYNALHHTDDGTTNKYDITADKSAIIQLMKEYATQQQPAGEEQTCNTCKYKDDDDSFNCNKCDDGFCMWEPSAQQEMSGECYTREQMIDFASECVSVDKIVIDKLPPPTKPDEVDKKELIKLSDNFADLIKDQSTPKPSEVTEDKLLKLLWKYDAGFDSNHFCMIQTGDDHKLVKAIKKLYKNK